MLKNPSTQVYNAVAPLDDATLLAGDPLQYPQYRELHASILVIYNNKIVKIVKIVKDTIVKMGCGL